MEAIVLRMIQFFENIITKLIEKLNFVTIMLILVLVGVMNKEEVFEWFAIVGKVFKTTFAI